MLYSEIIHLTVQFQQSLLSLEDVFFLIYDLDGIRHEESRALNVLRVLCNTWVLVFYGRVPASHWQQHPQGINLHKSRGIKRGSCVMLVIYVFINNRKEVYWDFLVRAPPAVELQQEQIMAAKLAWLF